MSPHLICTHPQIALRSCLLPGISFSSCVSFWHLGCRWAGWMVGLHVTTERKFQLKTWYAVVRNKHQQNAAWLYEEKISRCYSAHIFKSKICKQGHESQAVLFVKFQVFLLVSQEQLDKKNNNNLPSRAEQSKLKAESMRWDPVLENSSDSKGFWPWRLKKKEIIHNLNSLSLLHTG